MEKASFLKVKDPQTFTEIVKQYSRSLFQIAFQITKSKEDAEEVVQDCFMELIKQSHTIESSLSGWLHKMAANRAKNVIRSQSRRNHYEQQKSLNEFKKEYGEEWLAIIQNALEKLPENLRVPLILHYIEGKGQSEVGDLLGLNQSTISRRIHTGLEELRKDLEKTEILASTSSLAQPYGIPSRLSTMMLCACI